MTYLSYSTMTALIHEPHTWINKQMGLKTISTTFFEEGKACHRIIQDHVCGRSPHPLLSQLPPFPLVEEKEWDEQMKVTFPINSTYQFIGYVDGLNPEKKHMLEIKSGKKWTPSDFAKLVQWKLYALAKPEYETVWLVNTPRDLKLWMPQTIKIYNTEITKKDVQQAKDFIDKALYIIEHINEQTLHRPYKSRWCYYEGCEFCESC